MAPQVCPSALIEPGYRKNKAQLSLHVLCRLAAAKAYSLRRQEEGAQRFSGSFYSLEET